MNTLASSIVLCIGLVIPRTQSGFTFVECGTSYNVIIDPVARVEGEGSSPQAALVDLANNLGIYCDECPESGESAATPICQMIVPPNGLNVGSGGT